MWQVLKYVWAAPATMLGLFAFPLVWSTRGKVACVTGVIEMHAPGINWLLRRGVFGPISAITFGHVVLGADQRSLDRTRKHERVHVRQYERWGPAFLPAYLACSAWLWIRGRHPYLDNPFEVEAYREAP